MHVILSYESGRRAEGILLAVGPSRLRVVVQERNDDTLELSLMDGRWMSEDGEPVEIESLISDGETPMAWFYPRAATLTQSASN